MGVGMSIVVMTFCQVSGAEGHAPESAPGSAEAGIGERSE